MITFQDFQRTNDVAGFIWKFIQVHESSDFVKTAKEADLYDAHRNKGIEDFYRMYSAFNTSSKVVRTAAMGCNYFNRLNTQRCTYSLGNGVTFTNSENTKEQLGIDFDTKIKTLAYKSLIHGCSFGFWNKDKLFVFPITEFAPLWDEETGALRAGVRYWRLQQDKPLFAILYEEDGYTKFRSYTDKDSKTMLQMIEPKRGYLQEVQYIPAEGATVIGEQNYSSLPIIPMWGNNHHQSTLVGLKPQIDNYDLVLSGFADTVQAASEIFWLVENYGGMEQRDCNEFLERLKINHIATADTSEGGKITPYTQEVPTAASTTLLDQLHKQIFEDFGALDVHTVSANSTNDHLEAAYQPMDENADDFEYQIIDFVQQLLKVAGLQEDTPQFKRNKVSNTKEQVEVVMLEAQYLDDETILNKLPNITPDEVKSILEKKAGETAAEFEAEQERIKALEENAEEQEEPVEE